MSSEVSNPAAVTDRPFNVIFNVEGRVFHTSDSTVTSIPGSLLGDLSRDSKHFNATTNSYCFDRDSNLFPHILAAHRDGEIHVPQDVCAIRFRKELEFWKIPKSLIAPCCWSYYYSSYEDLEILNTLIKTLPENTYVGPKKVLHMLNPKEGDSELTERSEKRGSPNKASWRHQIWLFLEEPTSSKAAMVWCWLFVFVAIISVVLNIIWIEEWVRVDPYLAEYKLNDGQLERSRANETVYNEKMSRLLFTDPHKILLFLDCFCTMFFALEVCFHFTTCPYKLRYFSDWFTSMKVFLSFCMVNSTIFELRKDWLINDTFTFFWFLIKSMNTLRAVLILKLHKISATLNVMLLAFLNCKKELALLGLILLLLAIMFGGMIFAFEMDSDMFPNFLSSMWWALITMTTIGYGDFHPTRPMGYAVGAYCALEGIMMIALPIAVVASNFSIFKDRNGDLQNHLKDVKEEGDVQDKQHKHGIGNESTVDDSTEDVKEGDNDGWPREIEASIHKTADISSL